MASRLSLLVEWVDEQNPSPQYGVVTINPAVNSDMTNSTDSMILIRTTHSVKSRLARVLRMSNCRRSLERSMYYIDSMNRAVHKVTCANKPACDRSCQEMLNIPRPCSRLCATQVILEDSGEFAGDNHENCQEDSCRPQPQQQRKSQRPETCFGVCKRPFPKHEPQNHEWEDSGMSSLGDGPRRRRSLVHSTPLPPLYMASIKETKTIGVQTDELPEKDYSQLRSLVKRLYTMLLTVFAEVNGMSRIINKMPSSIRTGKEYELVVAILELRKQGQALGIHDDDSSIHIRTNGHAENHPNDNTQQINNTEPMRQLIKAVRKATWKSIHAIPDNPSPNPLRSSLYIRDSDHEIQSDIDEISQNSANNSQRLCNTSMCAQKVNINVPNNLSIRKYLGAKNMNTSAHNITNNILNKSNSSIQKSTGLQIIANQLVQRGNENADNTITLKNSSGMPSQREKIIRAAAISDATSMISIGSGHTKIPNTVFNKIDWNSYTNATRQLLQAVFSRRVLATHSLTGKQSPAFANKPAKQSLDPKLVDDIVTTVSQYCGVQSRLVRNCITIKCTDEAKLYRNRQQARRKVAVTETSETPSADSTESD